MKCAMRSPLDILRLQVTVPPAPGGMEQHVRRITDEQRSFGHRVRLVFVDGQVTHPDDLQIGFRRLVNLRPQSIRSFCYFLAALATLVRARSANVIHVHGDWSMVLAGRAAKWLTGARVLVVSVHGGPGVRSRGRLWLQRICFRLADMIHTTGRREAVEISDHVRCPVLWQASGISDAFLKTSRSSRSSKGEVSTRLVVTTAILRKKKNVDLVLDIAASLPDAQFVIFGDGPERSRLAQRIARERIGNVELRGYVGHETIIECLDSADVFLSTSLVEGTPTAMLEAMARGVPVVTSRSGDFSGIMDDGLTGYIIPGFDAEPYIAAIESLLQGSSEWGRMSRACVERSTQFAWSSAASVITEATISVISAADGGA